jgi:hypothetical protein
MRPGRSLAVMALVAGSSLGPARALASANYPPLLASHWGIAAKSLPVSGDGCTLCHKNDKGGTGSISQPFGITMFRTYGLKGAHASTLNPALDSDRAHATDSDHDTVSDYQEIVIDHTNPNDPKSLKLPEPPPPPAGGQGGEGDDSGAASGAGGAAEPSFNPGPPPPPSFDLPPPLVHGCALAHRRHADASEGALLVLLALLGRRARRRHAAHDPH